jgi:uncharacterized Zn-binding protein involved in type VI secretion
MAAAARVGDMHTCPMTEGGNPHTGGPIGPVGSPNVNIGGKAAARQGDQCTCAGSPDKILLGSKSVNINGKPAARQYDHTVHQGIITTGFPLVNIGG